jgi:SAM-dependent methyltransferase
MSRWYRFLYRVGFTPWEEHSVSVGEQLDELMTREESERRAPYGPVLDLGCGTGRWSVELARRGWDVIGVDVVPKAIRAARQRAQEAGVDVDFVEGDVTQLRSAGIAPGFSFILDVECFNHLGDAQRSNVGREVNAVTSPNATMLLLAWTRARRGPLPPGAGHEDLTAAFHGWQIVDEHPYVGDLPKPLKGAAPVWYRLTRVRAD